MNSNLVSKVITDKNGVKTTRWVKREKMSTSSMEIVPQVTVAPVVSAEDREKMIKHLSFHFGTCCDPQSFNVDGIISSIQSLESSTLSALTTYLGDHPEDNISIAAIWIDLYARHEPYLREMLTYHDAFDPSTDYSFVEESIYYLRECGDLPPMEDYSQATGQLQQTIRNLLDATETVISEAYEANREGNDPLLPADIRKLIIDRHEDFNRISMILVENPDIYTADRISLMLDSDVPSLSKGVL